MPIELQKGPITTANVRKIIEKNASLQEPYAVPAIQLFWCLSGRTNVRGEDVDRLQRHFDPKDDLTRMLRTIALADEVNAQLAKKDVKDLTDADRVIPIYYNGRPKHNEALKVALNFKLLPYPKRLFIIEPIFPENTIGQVQGFEKFLSTKGQTYYTIGVVTSEFHRLRAACTLGNQSPQILNEKGKPKALLSRNFLFYGIDKFFAAPGTYLDLASEPNAIINYSSRLNKQAPSIASGRSSNTFLLQSEVFDFVQERMSSCIGAAVRFGLFRPKLSKESLVLLKQSNRAAHWGEESNVALMQRQRNQGFQCAGL